MKVLSVVESLKREFTRCEVELEYLEDHRGFAWCGTTPQLPEQAGVYCLFSHGDTTIQRVGKAEGKKGLQQRFVGYTKATSIKRLERDATDRLWRAVMTNQLRGQKLSLYYRETPPQLLQATFFSLDGEAPLDPIKLHWARSLETYLTGVLRREYQDQVGKTHMLLMGRGD